MGGYEGSDEGARGSVSGVGPMSTESERHTPHRVTWRNSLIVRVIVICAVLFLCLLAAMNALTRSAFNQVAEARVADLERSLALHIQQHPEDEQLDSARAAMIERFDGLSEIAIAEPSGAGRSITIEQRGESVIVFARTILERSDGPVQIEASFALSPLTPYRDRFLLGVTGLFLVALVFLILLIYRTLRPLRALSKSLVRLSEGTLESVAVRPSDGEVGALGETFNDMVRALHEKDLVEANLRQAQRLSALGTLAAGVAHDIRNPLNAINLLSTHAMDTLDTEGGEERAKKQIATIKKEVARLEGIVSGFMSLGNDHELHRGSCVVDEVLEECARLIEKDAEDRGIRFTAELRAGGTMLNLDRKQWNRAILNILLNALDACPEGGRVRLFSRTTDTQFEIEVRDDGPGLTPEAAERVFDPYFTTKAAGTGLGLSITRGIVEEHGGTISLSSSEGCQVLITLPLEN